MWEEDHLKTTFIIDKGFFCYKVMSFGLKNAKATYQRMMIKVFRKEISRNLEMYVDDMLVKSRSLDNHLADLEENLLIMKHKKVRINPTKCAFGVVVKKFLGFMLNKRGIEANSTKGKVIFEMQSSITMKEVQRLNGQTTTLS